MYRNTPAIMLGLFVVLSLMMAPPIVHAVPDVAHMYNGKINSSSSNYDDWFPGAGCGYIQDIPVEFGSAIWSSTGIVSQNYYNGQVCGMCVQVTKVTNKDPHVPNTFPTPPFLAIITNTGNDVLTDYWLDFYRKPATGGSWWLEWQAVDCPVNDVGIKWQLASDSPYYFHVVPLYARLVVHRMCVWAVPAAGGNGSWVEMQRASNGYFQFGAGATYQPLTVPRVKAISVDGQVIEDSINVDLRTWDQSGFAILEGLSPGNFRPLAGAIASNPPNCDGHVTNDDGYGGGGGSSASRLYAPLSVVA